MPDHVLAQTIGVPISVDPVGHTGRSTKLTYLTPRWQGLQLGVSYTPRSDHKGAAGLNSLVSASSTKKPYDTDNLSSVLQFMHKFDGGLELALSGTSIFAKSNPEYQVAELKRQNIASFAFGGGLKYANIGFSAEYVNNGRSRELAGQGISNAGQLINFGLSYTHGPTKVSGGYYYSWRNALGGGTTPATYTKVKAKGNILGAAIDHKLAPGMAIYVEYANFQLKNPAAADEAARLNAIYSAAGGSKQYTSPTPSNNTNAFVLGSRLVF